MSNDHTTTAGAAASAALDTGDRGRLQLSCGKHGDFFSVGRQYARSVLIWSKCEGCMDDRARRIEEDEAERRATAKLAAIEWALDQAAVPVRFRDRSLASFQPTTERQRKALDVATAFVENWQVERSAGRWLVFAGPPGVGKSHLAIGILRALLPAHVGLYLTCHQLIQQLRATWRRDSERSELEVTNFLAQLPLLVIDEVGVQYGTDSEQISLFSVLDQRYRDAMPTILLTNLGSDGFKEFVGPRLSDRLAETATWVPFDGESFRKEARKQAAAAPGGAEPRPPATFYVPAAAPVANDWTRNAI